MISMTMEQLYYKAYGDPDQFWWDQYLRAVKHAGGENNINWGETVMVPKHRDGSHVYESHETWRDRKPLL